MRVFFFAPESPRLAALVRIVLGFVLLTDSLCHWRYAVELYSTFGPAIPTFVREIEVHADGSNPADDSRPRPLPRVEPILLAPIPGPRVAIVAHTLFVFALASVTIGWHTRTSLATAFFLALWLAPLDVAATFGKHFVLALHILLLLGFSRCGAAWSLDARFNHPRRGEACLLSCACPRRLIQILVCFVYAGAAITKFKSSSFANGDLLMFSLLDDRWGGGRFGMWLTTLRHVPLLLSHATLLFEIAFPILVWLPRWRLLLVGLAFVVHAAMGWLLSLGMFSPVMFAALPALLEEGDLAQLRRLCERVGGVAAAAAQLRRMGFQASPNSHGRAWKPILLAACHLLAAGAFVAAGCAIQFSCDWYGVFGRRSLPPLQEVSAGDFAEMLAERPPAWEDYFHRVELGSRFGGNQVFGSSDRFRIGQCAFVLTQMPMPHPAVELEGLLIAPDGRECARFTHHFDPGFSYTVNGFELTPELPPGSYRVILRVEEFIVAERRFELERSQGRKRQKTTEESTKNSRVQQKEIAGRPFRAVCDW
ncbi:MAG: HTTM domain-containing protein [Deltaproteobacteria bacterium]